MKKTKIVATISDKRCEVEFLEKLYRAGMNVVRLKYSSSGYGAGIEGGGECSESFG